MNIAVRLRFTGSLDPSLGACQSTDYQERRRKRQWEKSLKLSFPGTISAIFDEKDVSFYMINTMGLASDVGGGLCTTTLNSASEHSLRLLWGHCTGKRMTGRMVERG